MSPVEKIERSQEWQEKQEAAAATLLKQQEELYKPLFERATILTSMVPGSIVGGTGEVAIVLSEAEKNAIIAYAFIGLSELVSISSGQPMSFIWEGCIKRSIQNLRKDGMLA